MRNNRIEYLFAGLLPYQIALDIQLKWQKKRQNEVIENAILACEHPPTFTIGKSGKRENILINEKMLVERDISVHYIERGGDVTVHNPGQLVVYPILNLNDFNVSVPEYVHNLEQTIIETLTEFDVPAKRNPGFPGVWIDTAKIAAIGIKISRSVTMHGIAMNINNDLGLYSYINPCGIVNCRITSLSEQIGKQILIRRVFNIFMKHFSVIFDCQFVEMDQGEIINEKLDMSALT